MKLKNNFFYTLRENARSEDSVSGNLLVRSGMIKKVGNGIYMHMPLGFKVLQKIENIVREEMNKAGAIEVNMPCLIPEDIFVKSGRLDTFGDSIFTLNDRYNRDYLLGPTHEELFAIAASEYIKSYKDFPFNLYQIGRKYRDEARPRYGLIRIREFIMKDAYSFDKDYDGLEISYNKMYEAYKKIFDRIGLNYRIVKASTGVMGGLLSEEFQAISEIGEDTLVLCYNCDYASNMEVSECVFEKIDNDEMPLKLEKVFTPNVGKIEEVSKFLNAPITSFVKTLIYKIDDEFYACLLSGDRELNEEKVLKLLNKKEITLASFEETEEITGAKVGYAGPVGIKIPIIIDNEILNKVNFSVGANETDYHYKNVNLNDFQYDIVGDIKNVIEGDPCPKCGKKLFFKKGIEIGNTFKLGTKYSESLNLLYSDADNKLNPVVMGCYGIGLERIMTSIIEQNNDEYGIIWPINIAPYEVAIVVIDVNNEEQMNIANDIYNNLKSEKIDVLLDDRMERIGVKFNDIDLIGIPIRIVIGKKINDNLVEVKKREVKDSIDINKDLLIDKIKELLK